MSSGKFIFQLTCAVFVVLLLATSLAEAYRGGFVGQPARRLDCSVFCRKTGFSGYVGGCQCGFTLFANKRNQLNPLITKLWQSTRLNRGLYDSEGVLDASKEEVNEPKKSDSLGPNNRETEDAAK